MKILVADDNLEMLEAYASMLYGQPVELVLLESAEKCLDFLQKDSVACIISDLNMPGMDGVEFFEKVKKETDFSGVFIFVTAFWESNLNYLLEEGVHKVFEKPISYVDLCEYLKLQGLI